MQNSVEEGCREEGCVINDVVIVVASWGVGQRCNGQCCCGKAVGGVGHAMDDVLVGHNVGGWLAEGQDVIVGRNIWGECSLAVRQECQGAVAL